MKVAVVQTDPVFAGKKENVFEALKSMSSVNADLYVLPELFATGYNFIDADEVRLLAEKFEDGYTFAHMLGFARQTGSFVVYGFAETFEGRLYNSAAIVGYNGNVGLYRKIHLFDRERLFFSPGDLGFKVFDTPLGRIGVMICFDWYFPESARTLTLKGAQLIAHPANLVLPNCPDGMRTRCLENRIFAVTANRVGSESRGEHFLTYIGYSQITSPKGEILCRLPADKPMICVEQINPSEADSKYLNERNHMLNDRRPETYTRQ